MFLPFDAGPVRRAVQRLAAPLVWANWRALETLLTAQFKLRRNGLAPKTGSRTTSTATWPSRRPASTGW